jgi:hypothetical protein
MPLEDPQIEVRDRTRVRTCARERMFNERQTLDFENSTEISKFVLKLFCIGKKTWAG